MFRIVIISGGRLEKESALAFLEKNPAKIVIGVDGGLKFCQENGIVPDYIVGDFDTIEPEILKVFAKNPKIQTVKYQPEKDLTDTQAAVELAVKLVQERKHQQGKWHGTEQETEYGPGKRRETGQKTEYEPEKTVEEWSNEQTEIVLLGGTGSRMDHTLANIGCLKYASRKKVFMKIVDSNNCMYLYEKPFLLRKAALVYHRYLSLIALENGVSGLTIKGMKYDTENLDLEPLSSRGVSNEMTEDKAEIIFDSGSLLVIESKD